jgi:hypothetical protein
MKRKLFFAASFLLIAWSFTACEALSGCKVCQDVTYENNQEVFSTSETEFCGDDLIAKEATPDVSVGNQVIKVECR